jgi:hypothetical protein
MLNLNQKSDLQKSLEKSQKSEKIENKLNFRPKSDRNKNSA